jgi:hypothetical protein
MGITKTRLVASAKKRQRDVLQQHVDDCNKLARMFCREHGYATNGKFKFYMATHPQEYSHWRRAAMAYKHLRGVDVDSCLSELGLSRDF